MWINMYVRLDQQPKDTLWVYLYTTNEQKKYFQEKVNKFNISSINVVKFNPIPLTAIQLEYDLL